MTRSGPERGVLRGIRSCVRWLLPALVALAGIAGATGARAQALESVLEPGPLSHAHEKYEGECTTCHVKFDRNAQDKLCMDCHKDIGQDARTHQGMHGRMKPQACKSCHTDHKGRNAQIAAFDQRRFDHAGTEFALRGAHAKADCAKCHVPNAEKKPYRIPAHECVACHKKDDAHKGSLGPKCADCHAESDWKTAKFDHATTRFPLLGKHDAVKCADCHRNGQYKDTPMTCIACHKKDDHHKAQFGDKCESCHAASDWKSIRFNHDTDTHYALLGKHRAAKCESCHVGNLYKVKLATACIECHRKDDKHKGSLGDTCSTCHTERDWKEPAKFDHAKTVFPLAGKHANVQCKDCHKDTMFKEAPTTCVGCHRKDDKHKGTLGDDCAKCHNDRSWKKTSFDHAKSAFPLLGKHAAVQCGDCHKSADYRAAPKDCYSCHQKDDRHEGQEGRACETCHEASAWKTTPRFDHGLTPFPLLGKHEKVECKSCHADARFKNAKTTCVSCHAKDDKHKRTLGTLCEQCHNARTWKAWSFDHDKRTRFVLDGKHAGVACSGCHSRPMEGRVVTSSQCVSCHTKDDVHDGSYGKACQQCHVTSDFRTIRSRAARPVGALEPSTRLARPVFVRADNASTRPGP